MVSAHYHDAVRGWDVTLEDGTRFRSRFLITAIDIIIYATGFDAITGSFDRIDIRGVDRLRLEDRWKHGPQTYLGVMVEGLPNMMMLMGPHTGLGNISRGIECNVDWVTGVLRHARP